MDTQPMIELRGLRRHFGSTKAVDDVSFEVYRGQVFRGHRPQRGRQNHQHADLSRHWTCQRPVTRLVDGFSVINDPIVYAGGWGSCPITLAPTPT